VENKPSTEKLEKVCGIAEEKLPELKDNDNKRYKKVSIALEEGYALLNRDKYTQKEVDDATEKIWLALNGESKTGILWIFIFGVLFSGAFVFTAYQTYSFVQTNWNNHNIQLPGNNDDNVSNLVLVNYKETNIVDLKDLMTVSDSEGLQNSPQEFQISNDSSEVGSLNYEVNYTVNIVELNQGSTNIINKKYLKYSLSYKDDDGNLVTEPIKTFADLKQNADGSYELFSGKQAKDGYTDFKVVIWLSSNAGNDQQGKSYTFMFKISAAVNNTK
jgi:hypothetical protein